MKTTLLELSIALKEAGAKQEGALVYRRFPDWEMELVPDHQMRPGRLLEEYYSFDCYELLERLPTRIDGKGHQRHWWFHMIKACVPKYGVGYARWIINELPGVETIYLDNFNASGDTPAEALGKLYLWCLQNGHCKE